MNSSCVPESAVREPDITTGPWVYLEIMGSSYSSLTSLVNLVTDMFMYFQRIRIGNCISWNFFFPMY